jgi:uncharacterized membrane protein
VIVIVAVMVVVVIVIVMTLVPEVMPVHVPSVRMPMSGRHRRTASRLLGEVGRRSTIVLRIHQEFQRLTSSTSG